MAQRKGKYSHVIGTLPELPGVPPERRDLVEQVKQEILAPPNGVETLHGDIVDTMTIIQANVRSLLALEKRAAASKAMIDPETGEVTMAQRAAEFARVYAELRAIKERFDEWQSSLNLLIEAYMWLMVERMEEEGTTSMRLANGQPVSFFKEPYARVVDAEALRQWFIKNGLERKLQPMWQTTNSLCKEMLLAGQATIGEDGTVTPAPMPDGVELLAKTTVRLGSE